MCFCAVFRYYDHKRTAAKKEQKTVEAAEKVNYVKQVEGNVFTITIHVSFVKMWLNV